jgi:hypothetical protein
MAPVLGLYLLSRVKTGLKTMVHADRLKKFLKMTSYTNMEIQPN